MNQKDVISNKWMSLIYEEQGKKKVLNKRTAKYVAIGFCAISILALLFQPSPPTLQKRSDFGTVPASSPQLDLPEHDEPTAAPKKISAVSNSQQLFGPTIILRPGAEEIPPGTVVIGKLITAATDGPVKVELSEDVDVNGEVKFRSGAILIGIGQSDESRVQVQFKKIVQDGSTYDVSAVVLDQKDQLVGIQASKFSSEAIRLGASIGLNFAGGLAEGLKEKSVQSGVAIDTPTMKNALLNGASRATLDHARTMMQDARSKKYSLTVDANTPVLIFFTGNK